MGANTVQIAGGIIGGVLGLVGAIGAGLGFWRYSRNKSSREAEQLADFIRSSLNLKDVDNFHSENGQKYVTIIHALQRNLQASGIDTSNMRPLELGQLADDVADAARNKIWGVTSNGTKRYSKQFVRVKKTSINPKIDNDKSWPEKFPRSYRYR